MNTVSTKKDFSMYTYKNNLIYLLDTIPFGLRRTMIIIHDLTIAALSIPISIWIRLEGANYNDEIFPIILVGIPSFVFIFSIVAFIFGLHRGMWRYVSIRDLVIIIYVSGLSISIFYLLTFLIYRLEGVPRLLPVLQFVTIVFLLGGSRMIYRMLREGSFLTKLYRDNSSQSRMPILLFGIGPHTFIIIRALKQLPTSPFEPIGIVADDREVGVRRYVLGIPVLGYETELEDIVTCLSRSGNKPLRLVLTTKLSPQHLTRMIERARRLEIQLCCASDPLEFKDLTSYNDIKIRPVSIQDLLDRPQINLDQSAIDHLISGKKILVTGAGGSIGGELVKQIVRRNPSDVILVDNNEFNLYNISHDITSDCDINLVRTILCDIRDRDRLSEVFRTYRPEIVFHAAALKHVPLVEQNACEGILTNVIGTKNVAELCISWKVSCMVMVSTDKAVNPTNVMGASKRLAELYCQALDLLSSSNDNNIYTKFIIVRFGNVLGSSGSVIPLFQKQLECGGPITVTHPDIERYFMTISEAVGLILHAAAKSIYQDEYRGRIFILDMGKPVKILDLAKKLIKLAGLEPGKDIDIVFTGLRPGEKMYEELIDTTEERIVSKMEGMVVVSSNQRKLKYLRKAILSLESACKKNDSTSALLILEHVVPGYKSRSKNIIAA